MNLFGLLTRRKPEPPLREPPLRGIGGPASDPAAAAAALLDHAVFVCGRGRSGSSLLLRLFDGHPQVYAIPRESRLLTEIGPAFRRSGDRSAVEAYLLDRFADHRAGEAQAEAARLIRQGVPGLDPAAAGLGRELIRIALEALAAARDPTGARCFLEKTPKNEEHLDEIFRTFPQARVIQLVRDPRAVYLSNKRSEAYRMDPAFVARQWVKSLRCALRQVVKFGRAPQMLILRYEDLVGRPRETLEILCGFLEVDFDEALTRPTVYGNPWQGNAYGEDAAKIYAIEPSKADSWRDEITATENLAIVAEARLEMSLLGYPLEAPR
jgi:hypothetical protein